MARPQRVPLRLVTGQVIIRRGFTCASVALAGPGGVIEAGYSRQNITHVNNKQINNTTKYPNRRVSLTSSVKALALHTGIHTNEGLATRQESRL